MQYTWLSFTLRHQGEHVQNPCRDVPDERIWLACLKQAPYESWYRVCAVCALARVLPYEKHLRCLPNAHLCHFAGGSGAAGQAEAAVRQDGAQAQALEAGRAAMRAW